MYWLTDEMLFYGGMALAAVSLVAQVVYLLVFRTGTVRLDALLDQEYGAESKTEK